MSGIFGGGSAPAKKPAEVQAVSNASAASARSEERAESDERTQMRGAQRRRRLRRTGGLRLLFSPARMEGPDQPATTTNLGGGQ